MVKSLAFRSDPELQHVLWRFTPFIDYPDEGTTYDWRWEREWRVRGDLRFGPQHVAVLFAPQSNHETIRELWRLGRLTTDTAAVPPVIDVHWPHTRQVDTLSTSAANTVRTTEKSISTKQVHPL